jgi:hypothetical protein
VRAGEPARIGGTPPTHSSSDGTQNVLKFGIRHFF